MSWASEIYNNWPVKGKKKQSIGAFNKASASMGVNKLMTRLDKFIEIAVHDPESQRFVWHMNNFIKNHAQCTDAEWDSKMTGWKKWYGQHEKRNKLGRKGTAGKKEASNPKGRRPEEGRRSQGFDSGGF